MNWQPSGAYCHTSTTHSVAKVWVNGLVQYEAYRKAGGVFLGAFPDAEAAKKACSGDKP